MYQEAVLFYGREFGRCNKEFYLKSFAEAFWRSYRPLTISGVKGHITIILRNSAF